MENCLFCKMINKEIEIKKIYEDEKVLAFLDINPKSEGHTLVIPKKHVENFMELENFEIESLKNVINSLQKKYKFKDFKIISNNGKLSGQEIFHQHFHIVPFYDVK